MTDESNRPHRQIRAEPIRHKARRYMAYVCMGLCAMIVLSFLAALFSDRMAARIEHVWPPFSILFPALSAQIMHYVWTGSRETRDQISSKDKPE